MADVFRELKGHDEGWMVKGILRLRKNAHFVGVFAALRMTGRLE
jgi:hypothetical protein